MDHSEFSRMLDNYASLDDTGLSLLEAHAAECEDCRAELEFFKSIMLTSASLPIPEPPADLAERVMNRIDKLPPAAKRFDRAVNNVRLNAHRYMTAAACLAVGLVVGLNSKMITDRLTDNSSDGVISTSVTVTDTATGETLTDYEIEGPVPTEAPDTADTVLAETPSEIPDTTSVPEVTSAPAAKPATTAKPVSTARPAVTAKPIIAADTPAAPIAEPVVTEAPAPAVVPTHMPLPTPVKGKYVIAHEIYYIPDTEPTAAPTEAPAVQTEPVKERYQIASAVSEEIDVPSAKGINNVLVVHAEDSRVIADCMNKSWIRAAERGYVASTTAFGNFLAMLDAAGVQYSYAEYVPPQGEVSFIMIVN